MFSMFGRAWVPTKGAANFLHAENTEIMGDSPELTRVMSKKGRQFFRKLAADTRTVMTKKGRQFFRRKMGEGVPTFFPEQGPAESKSGPDHEIFWMYVSQAAILHGHAVAQNCCMYFMSY